MSIMVETATPSFLKNIKNIYQAKSATKTVTDYIQNPWYIVSAVAFSASNRPECIPGLFTLIMDELHALNASQDEKLQVVIRLREALFKGGMISGYSRVNISNFQPVRYE